MPLHSKRLWSAVIVGTAALLSGTFFLSTRAEPEIPWLEGTKAERFPRFGVTVYHVPGSPTQFHRDAETWAKANGFGVRTLKGSNQLIVYEAGRIILSANPGSIRLAEVGNGLFNAKVDRHARATTIIRVPRPGLWTKMRHRLLTPHVLP